MPLPYIKKIKPQLTLPPAKERSCLKCRKLFQSTGLFLCDKCGDQNQDIHFSKRDLSPSRASRIDS